MPPIHPVYYLKLKYWLSNFALYTIYCGYCQVKYNILCKIEQDILYVGEITMKILVVDKQKNTMYGSNEACNKEEERMEWSSHKAPIFNLRHPFPRVF